MVQIRLGSVVAVAHELQQEHEQVQEIQIQVQRAQNGGLAQEVLVRFTQLQIGVLDLLGVEGGIMRARGRWRELTVGARTGPAMPTLHPAYLLRTPLAKRQAWRDLLAVQERLLAPSEK